MDNKQIENSPVETTEYKFIRKHPDGAGDILCVNCDMIMIVYDERKEQLRKHTLVCKHCGARFTGMVKEEDVA